MSNRAPVLRSGTATNSGPVWQIAPAVVPPASARCCRDQTCSCAADATRQDREGGAAASPRHLPAGDARSVVEADPPGQPARQAQAGQPRGFGGQPGEDRIGPGRPATGTDAHCPRTTAKRLLEPKNIRVPVLRKEEYDPVTGELLAGGYDDHAAAVTSTAAELHRAGIGHPLALQTEVGHRLAGGFVQRADLVMRGAGLEGAGAAGDRPPLRGALELEEFIEHRRALEEQAASGSRIGTRTPPSSLEDAVAQRRVSSPPDGRLRPVVTWGAGAGIGAVSADRNALSLTDPDDAVGAGGRSWAWPGSAVEIHSTPPVGSVMTGRSPRANGAWRSSRRDCRRRGRTRRGRRPG